MGRRTYLTLEANDERNVPTMRVRWKKTDHRHAKFPRCVFRVGEGYSIDDISDETLIEYVEAFIDDLDGDYPDFWRIDTQRGDPDEYLYAS